MRLSFLMPKPQADAQALYAAVVAEARRPAWYRVAGFPDTIDGRFAVLTNLLAIADVRLERGGDDARALGPRLAEAFIADMDAQMREAGFGDPSLGKKVRRMVGVLAGRVEDWRHAVEAPESWDSVARSNLYGDAPPAETAVKAGIESTRGWWQRLQHASDEAIRQGQIG